MDLRKGEVARVVNASILQLSERLDALHDPTALTGFLCECGCWAVVEITAEEYVMSGGAYMLGHVPTTTPGC